MESLPTEQRQNFNQTLKFQSMHKTGASANPDGFQFQSELLRTMKSNVYPNSHMSTLTEKDIVINILQDGLNINLRDTKGAYEYVKRAIREKRFV